MTNPSKMRRKTLLTFALAHSARLWRFVLAAIMSPMVSNEHDQRFAAFLSGVLSTCDQSISNVHFEPNADGTSAPQVMKNLNALASSLYSAPFARITTSGSSGAMLAAGLAISTLNQKAHIALIDCVAHQSTYGALISSGCDVVQIPRKYVEEYKLLSPTRATDVIALVRKYGSTNISFICLVSPSYCGFRAPEEEVRIYEFCKRQDPPIPVLVDGAWAACHGIVGGFPLSPFITADAMIVSLHKKGLAPSPVALVLMRDAHLADQFDRLCELGHGTTSPPMHLIATAEHRLALQASGSFAPMWGATLATAHSIRTRICKEVHPDVRVISSEMINATHLDNLHLLLDVQNLPVTGYEWDHSLAMLCNRSSEKADTSHLLLLVSPQDIGQEHRLFGELRDSLNFAIQRKKEVLQC